MKFIIFWAIVIFAIFAALFWIAKKAQGAKTAIFKRLHRWYFLVRWWLVGKYHCDIPPSYKRFWWIAHKITWLLLSFCVIYTISHILGIDK